jgi:hypothetical protein
MFRIRIKTYVADPGSCAFWTPGSGVGFFRISGPRSSTHISESLVTILWVKIALILGKFVSFYFVKFVHKKGKTTNFPPSSFLLLLDLGWIKIEIRVSGINIPNQQH